MSVLKPDTAHVAILETKEAMTKDESAPSDSTEHRQLVVTFIVMGIAILYFWNAALNALYSVVVIRFEDYKWLSETFTATYSSTSFLTALFFSWTGAARSGYFVVAGSCVAVLALCFPIFSILTSGWIGAATLTAVSGISGIADTTFQVAGYCFAVIVPNRQYAGWLSLGYGLSGVVTFFSWMLLSQWIFHFKRGGVSRAVWTHFIIAGVWVAAAIVGFVRIRRRPIMLEAIQKASGVLPQEQQYIKSYFQVFKSTWIMQVGMALLMGVSMMAFPLIGPYRWNLSILRNDILLGLFQCCDCLGRFIPNLTGWVPGVMISGNLLFILTLLRGLLLWLFIKIARNPTDQSLLNKYSVQVLLMLSLAFSHGWYASVYMSRVPEGVNHPSEKARASSMAVCLLIMSISCGLWMAKLV